MGQPRAGIEAKLYYGTAGGAASTEVGEAREVTVNGSTTMGKVVRRSSRQESNVPTTIAVGLEFDLVPDDDSAVVAAFTAAWMSHTALAFHAKSLETGLGPNGDFFVEGFNRSEPAQDVQSIRVTLVPTIKERAWAWS